jgi:hypothetical protein
MTVSFAETEGARLGDMLNAMPILSAPAITQFRQRRPGPELLIQETVEQRVRSLMGSSDADLWTAAGIPLGAGVPDLVVVSYHRDVLALANVDISNAHILAYLRSVGRARLETIADRLQISEKSAQVRLEVLLDAHALEVCADVFALPTVWREILPEIVTIEVKVSDWRKAVEQAGRNRIFAHRSYVALPERAAQRVRVEPLFGQLGLGLIGVADDKSVHVLRRARWRQPVVWAYYYRLAGLLAKSFSN